METNIMEIKSFFKLKTKSFIEGREDGYLLEESCSNIIENILERKKLNKDKFFDFSSLFNISELDRDNEKQKAVFIKTVYILVHPNVDFLEQKFHFLNDDSNWYDLDIETIYESYKTNVYIDPRNERQISKVEFNEIVLPYFVPSDLLISKLEEVNATKTETWGLMMNKQIILTEKQAKALASGTKSKPRQSKYRNVKTKHEGITFDSKKECERYKVLKQWQQKGLIKNLVLQPKFLIADAVYLDERKQRARYYIADFMYQDQDGKQVVEDVKGMRTDIYKLKRHLVKAIHGIEIKEVY